MGVFILLMGILGIIFLPPIIPWLIDNKTTPYYEELITWSKILATLSVTLLVVWCLITGSYMVFGENYG